MSLYLVQPLLIYSIYRKVVVDYMYHIKKQTYPDVTKHRQTFWFSCYCWDSLSRWFKRK